MKTEKMTVRPGEYQGVILPLSGYIAWFKLSLERGDFALLHSLVVEGKDKYGEDKTASLRSDDAKYDRVIVLNSFSEVSRIVAGVTSAEPVRLVVISSSEGRVPPVEAEEPAA